MTATSSARAILIAGPTASGKSGLALRLAEQLGGVVINADSMQVYRELRILTARPTAEDEARAPHALYGFVSGAEAYSAGRYAVDAAHAIAEARTSGRVPILVGGTGLYFKALLEGLSPVPPIDPDVRAYWRGQAAARPAADLHAILARATPRWPPRLMPSDPQRIVRALEVLESTGRSLADWQRAARQAGAGGTARPCAYWRMPERAMQASRDRRALRRDDGWRARWRRCALCWPRPSGELPFMRALGVARSPLTWPARASLEAAVAAAKAETRQYAKRQLTWLREYDFVEANRYATNGNN